MEFPDIGEHCSLSECRRLDFLPIKCSCCHKIFCSNHFRFEAHNCPEANKDDHQAPICPLCNKLVSIKPGESPDFKVSEHIDNNCNLQQEKVYKNRCSISTCKKKELMPLNCESCGLNHCLAHRHPSDHNCQGSKVNKSASGRPSQLFNSFSRKSATAYEAIRTNVINTFNNVNSPSVPAATIAARSTGTSQVPAISALQGNLTEEEALNIAIQESLSASNRGSNSHTQTASNAQKCRVS